MMGHVSYRVGAIVVALGMGIAVATAGVAPAEPEDPGSSTNPTSDSSTSSSTDDNSKSGLSSSAPSAPASPPTSTTITVGGSSSTDPSTTPDPRTGVVQSTGGAQASSDITDSQLQSIDPTSTPSQTNSASTTASTPADDSDGSTALKSPSTPASTKGQLPVNGGSTRAAAGNVSVSVAASPTAQANPDVDISVLQSPTAFRSFSTTTSRTLQTAAGPTTSSVQTQLTTATTSLVTPQLNPAPFTGLLAPLNIVTSVVSTVLDWVGSSLSMTAGTNSPIQTPLLWTVYAFARREFEQTLLALTGAAGVQQVTASLVESPNLLVNPGAEVGDPSLSGYSSVTVPGWTVTGTPTVIEYNTPNRLPWPFASPGPTLPWLFAFPSSNTGGPGSGKQFFGGGNVGTSTISQTVDLSLAASDIDAGAVPYTLSGRLGGFLWDPSAAFVTVDFLDAAQSTLGSGSLGPVTVLDRWLQTGLLERASTGTVPVGTRSARVVVTFSDWNPPPGTYNNAYADNLSFTVGADLPAPPPPTPPKPRVGELDHVFLVYMENKGFTDIVGSPNAPYLNGLINQYGFGANYYALAHPSDPNYYPILGGTDFGFNYNCPVDCFDAPSLADNIEAAGKNWAGYVEGMPFPGARESAPGYSPDSLPFFAFSDIYNDPARAAAHLFPLTQMATDLATPATAPDFVWFAANDETNMEGPTGTVFGALAWLWSQLTDHQYNVKAGDDWLQRTIPLIVDSTVWNDIGQRSAIFITFDEDYNNLSLGIGNQLNHIPMVVIPSQGAVSAGMRDGHLIAENYNNHYSLLRTIEDALQLPRLTNNDTYASQMNEYWEVPPLV
jgi:Phosphoesterase family